MARVIIYEPQLDFMINRPPGAVGRWLSRKGRVVVALAKSQVGVRTGALRPSIHMRHLRDPRGQYLKIGSELPYALLHHEGSRPHVIRPKQAKLLKFVTRGQMIMTHVVKHPGTAPNRYLTGPMRRVF